ncbi:hypothetical protein GF325_18325 [Candidatus Bathyarchaeota archaeon]|nr:hypothetical protein [Candidatus Bathyarchaeota archaeon]
MEILGFEIREGYELVFILTLVIIGVKLVMTVFLAVKLLKRKKKEASQSTSTGFLSSVLLLMACWLVSRIFYMIFDFFLTEFYEARYPLTPNIWFWKVASLVAAIGIGTVVLTIDRKILDNKFKGVFGIIIYAGAIVQFIYPVNTLDDFYLVSTIGVIAGLGALLVPIMFLWIGAKAPGLRKIAWSVAAGGIIYVLGNSMVNTLFLDLFTSIGLPADFTYVFSTSLKVIGLLLLTYGGARFKA